MKKFFLFFTGILCLTFNACSPQPTGNPVQDAATMRGLIQKGDVYQVEQFEEDILEYYMQHYSGPEAKKKLQEFGDNI